MITRKNWALNGGRSYLKTCYLICFCRQTSDDSPDNGNKLSGYIIAKECLDHRDEY